MLIKDSYPCDKDTPPDNHYHIEVIFDEFSFEKELLIVSKVQWSLDY